MTQQDVLYVDNYLRHLTAVLAELPREPLIEISAILREARGTGHRIFVFGNGGSAATANIVTNIDATPPEVVASTPTPDASWVEVHVQSIAGQWLDKGYGGIDVAVCGNAQYDDGDPETSSWFNGGQAGSEPTTLDFRGRRAGRLDQYAALARIERS